MLQLLRNKLRPCAFVALAILSGWLAESKADNIAGFAVGIQKAGVFQGAAPTLNAGTGLSVSLASGVATFTATGASSSRGIFASAPACGAAQTGNTYYATDVSIVEQCNGTSYQAFAYGSPVTLPSLVSFTFQNQGGASIATNGFSTLTAPSGTGDNVRGLFVTLPAKPFTLDACFNSAISQDEFNQAGMYESDGTKLLTLGLQTGINGLGGNTNNSAAWAVSEWTSVTAFMNRQGSSFWSATAPLSFCMRWVDDSTNNTWFVSVDNGFSYNEILQMGDTAYLTPTRIGWFMDINRNSGGIAQSATTTLYHWLAH